MKSQSLKRASSIADRTTPACPKSRARSPAPPGLVLLSLDSIKLTQIQVAAMTKERVRCVIYTRKSSEEGLEQSFNSLEAQREACIAYIHSQKHEGWTALSNRYDDGGFSGGNMERAGLQRLLDDIKAGKLDTVVVYKVDRLTRSLTDFAKIIDIFDSHKVSFVSVTQHFNTTSSMGRLTLNVLLSFAQFEREITGERIRDKIAASKKKGIWMGGLVPLGYDLDRRKLVPNTKESVLVCNIFSAYLKVGCVSKLAVQLDQEKVRSKVWVTRTGVRLGGVAFARGALYSLLRNRLYIGEIPHRDQWYRGEHKGIVPHDLWDKSPGSAKQQPSDASQVHQRAGVESTDGSSRRRGGQSLHTVVHDQAGETLSLLRLSACHQKPCGPKYWSEPSTCV